MGNCLKTQLKEAVQNDNLVKPGELLLSVNTSNGSDFRIYNTDGTHIPIRMITSTGSFWVSDGANPVIEVGREDTNIENTLLTVLPDGTYKFAIGNKYSITRLDGNLQVNLSNLKYSHCTIISCTSTGGSLADLAYQNIMEGVSILGGICDGNLTDIADCTTINLSPDGGNLIGSLAALSSKTSLLYLNLDCTYMNITGSISDLLGCSNLNTLRLINNNNVNGSLADFISNGALVLPNLMNIIISACPNITKNQEDIDALRALGVTVTV